jgi:hypothetical protein
MKNQENNSGKRKRLGEIRNSNANNPIAAQFYCLIT